MTDVTLLTPTADRPRAITLCRRWVRRMIARAVEHNPGLSVEWLIADGGQHPVRDHLAVSLTPGLERFDVVYHRAHPHACPKRNFRFNLIGGLQDARGDVVLFIEDDDWYHAEYLCAQLRWLENVELAGEGRAKYYNLQSRRYRVNGNARHASLCQTAIRRAVVPRLVEQIRRDRSAFVDMHLWRHNPPPLHLTPHSQLCVGIKGLPGKAGIGIGHRLQDDAVDHDGSVLRRWLGEDAAVYEGLRE